MVAFARSSSSKEEDEDIQPLFNRYPTLDQNNRAIAPLKEEQRHSSSPSGGGSQTLPLLNLTIPTPQPSPLPVAQGHRDRDPAGLVLDFNKRNSLGLELEKRQPVVERRRSRPGMEQDKEKGPPVDGGTPKLNSILLGGSGPSTFLQYPTRLHSGG